MGRRDSGEQEPWAVYARISRVRRTDGQLETLGVERQQPPAEALVGRMGGTVYQVYVDNDLSAYSGRRRPAYERMLADVGTGRVRGIAAWHPDRLTRQPSENERLIDVTERHGTRFATVLAGEHDLATSAGRLMFRQLGIMARYESEHRAERLRLKYAQMAEAGVAKSNRRAFGYRSDGMRLNRREAALIGEAASRILERGETAGAVLRDWRARGIVSPQGNPISSSVLRRILCSPRVAGLRQHGGKDNIVGPARWPAIISVEQRERLLRFYDGRRIAKTRTAVDPGGVEREEGYSYHERQDAGRPARYVYSGFLRCGKGCERHLTVVSKGSARRCYQCQASPHRGGCGLSVTLPSLEEEMDRRVATYICGPVFAAALERRMAAGRAGDVSPVQLEQDRTELAEIDVVSNTRFYTPKLRARRGELQVAIQDAEARMAAQPQLHALAGIPRARLAFEAAWRAMDVEERRRVLDAVLDHVVIEPRGRGQRFDPSRIKPAWKD